MMNHLQRAFTLIELLVVISIISLLISILLPALSGARNAGMNTQCLSTVRQMHLAGIMYTNDYSDWLPPGRDAQASPIVRWTRQFDYYGISASNRVDVVPLGVLCPSESRRRVGTAECSDYLVNTRLVGDRSSSTQPTWDARPHRVLDVHDPTSMMWFMDNAGITTTNYNMEMYWLWRDPMTRGPAYRHSERANVGFVDGHIQTLSREAAYAVHDTQSMRGPGDL